MDQGLVKGLALFLLLIYLVGVSFSVMYFYYQFARNHGFLCWLLFGEIVAIVKASIWPIFFILSIL